MDACCILEPKGSSSLNAWGLGGTVRIKEGFMASGDAGSMDGTSISCKRLVILDTGRRVTGDDSLKGDFTLRATGEKDSRPGFMNWLLGAWCGFPT